MSASTPFYGGTEGSNPPSSTGELGVNLNSLPISSCDADEQLGQPVISNGLPLAQIHHAAFDAHLIGV